MILDISPTRMELLKLRKKRAIATRGHKLLKDKLDELIRRLLELVKEASDLRKSIDSSYSQARSLMAFAGYATFPEAARSALLTSEEKMKIEIDYESILNIKSPLFSVAWESRGVRSYGFTQTSVGLDRALEAFGSVTEGILKLAQIEKKIELIASEIQKTRRRVNALEYILIPNIMDTIKFITMKLDETERNSKTQLMRIKDIVRT